MAVDLSLIVNDFKELLYLLNFLRLRIGILFFISLSECLFSWLKGLILLIRFLSILKSFFKHSSFKLSFKAYYLFSNLTNLFSKEEILFKLDYILRLLDRSWVGVSFYLIWKSLWLNESNEPLYCLLNYNLFVFDPN